MLQLFVEVTERERTKEKKREQVKAWLEVSERPRLDTLTAIRYWWQTLFHWIIISQHLEWGNTVTARVRQSTSTLVAVEGTLKHQHGSHFTDKISLLYNDFSSSFHDLVGRAYSVHRAVALFETSCHGGAYLHTLFFGRAEKPTNSQFRETRSKLMTFQRFKDFSRHDFLKTNKWDNKDPVRHPCVYDFMWLHFHTLTAHRCAATLCLGVVCNLQTRLTLSGGITMRLLGVMSAQIAVLRTCQASHVSGI